MPRPGKVYLVGAGPGDPGLITLRGVECLAGADLVLYDGLVNPLLLRHTRADCERTCRTASAAGRHLDQQEINAHLVAAAQSGKTVVRLKGGDPFIFGRGSEEAAALAAAGIPYEVVPGVTAAIAATAYAGISLTHRDHASAVAFVTGHEHPGKSDSTVDFALLARFPGTLVFYMGLHRLPEIAAALIEHGLSPTTPAAVISRGTWPSQRFEAAPLSELPDRVRLAGLHAPSLIVVGECVSQHERLTWFTERPLLGLRVGVTRPVGQADGVSDALWNLGAQPVSLPTIEIRPVEDTTQIDEVLSRLASFDWIVFTSVNGVRALLGRLWATGGDVRRLGNAKLAAIGDGTAAALADFQLRADLVPPEFRAESLAAALTPHVTGRSVLWARASRGRDVLPTHLRAAGARLEELVTYQNLDVTEFSPEAISQLERGEIDWIALSSPSIARNLAKLLPAGARSQLGNNIKLASISPVTSAAAEEIGLPIAAEAGVYNWDGLIAAIVTATTSR